MTDNERRAREILTATTTGEVSCLASALYIGGKKHLPKLTDVECKDIAINYPLSLQQVRDAFPREKL